MVKHIVTFKLSGSTEERAAVALRFAEALKALPGQIECLESIEVGINENPAEDWDVVLTATLPSLADVAVYAAHVAAASIIAGCKAARACVDYTVG